MKNYCNDDHITMRIFYKKFLLIIFPFFFLSFVLNFAYKKSFYWKTQRVQSKFLNVPDEIQLANLGSSQGHCSFNYDDFPEYKCFNFALPWQHNKYNYYVLNYFLKMKYLNYLKFLNIFFLQFFLNYFL